MREYIVNLTNNLIGKNHYDEMFQRTDDQGGFIDLVKLDLLCDDVREMGEETLGKIMFSFEIGDVPADNPCHQVDFFGDCGELLREIVSVCLAFAILSRLNGQSKSPYKLRRSVDLVESGFKGTIDKLASKRKGIPPIQRDVPFFKPAELKAHLAKLPQTETKLDFIGYAWKSFGEYIGVFEDKKNCNRFNLSKNQCQQANNGVNALLMSEVLAKWPRE